MSIPWWIVAIAVVGGSAWLLGLWDLLSASYRARRDDTDADHDAERAQQARDAWAYLTPEDRAWFTEHGANPCADVPPSGPSGAVDVNGKPLFVGDRVRWIGYPGERGPQHGATGWCKSAAVHHVWFWLDEPTGIGPGGEYWDVPSRTLERID